MKKKLIYAVSLPIVALSLASCSKTDYMSHDFDIVIPEKDSKAKNEYNLNNSKESDEFNKACLEISTNAEKDFFNKYSSIVVTRKSVTVDDSFIKASTTSSANNQKKFDESKIILDYKNNSHYFYNYAYSMKDDVVTSYSKVESKSFVSGENTYTVATEITLYNYLFSKTEKEVASGTVKIVTTHQEDIEKYRNQSILTFDSYSSEYDSGTAYTNDDFSYIYYTDGDVVMIAEDGLFKYRTEPLISLSTGLDYSGKSDLKVEYLDKSVLSDKYDTKDYIEYTEFNPYMTFFNGYFFIDVLLSNVCNNDTFRSSFTITKAENN